MTRKIFFTDFLNVQHKQNTNVAYTMIMQVNSSNSIISHKSMQNKGVL